MGSPCAFWGKDGPKASRVENGGDKEEGKDGKVGDKKEAFPYMNDGESVVRLHRMLYWWRVGTVLAKIMRVVGAIGV